MSNKRSAGEQLGKKAGQIAGGAAGSYVSGGTAGVVGAKAGGEVGEEAGGYLEKKAKESLGDSPTLSDLKEFINRNSCETAEADTYIKDIKDSIQGHGSGNVNLSTKTTSLFESTQACDIEDMMTHYGDISSTFGSIKEKLSGLRDECGWDRTTYLDSIGELLKKEENIRRETFDMFVDHCELRQISDSYE